MVTAGTLDYVVVTPQSTVPSEMTTYTINIKVKHKLPVNSQIIIKYPTQIEADRNEFSCTLSSRVSGVDCYLEPWQFVKTITISYVNEDVILGGSFLTIILNGMINPKTSEQTDSFEILTKTSDGYLIDQTLSGVYVESSCDFPCRTCLP